MRAYVILPALVLVLVDAKSLQSAVGPLQAPTNDLEAEMKLGGLGRGITGCSCKKRFTESDTKKEVILGLPVLKLAEHCYGELSGLGVFGCDQKCYLCYDGVKSICSGKCDATAKASFFRGGGSSTKTHLSNGGIRWQISNQKEYKAALFPICIVSNQTELQQRIDTKGMIIIQVGDAASLTTALKSCADQAALDYRMGLPHGTSLLKSCGNHLTRGSIGIRARYRQKHLDGYEHTNGAQILPLLADPYHPPTISPKLQVQLECMYRFKTNLRIQIMAHSNKGQQQLFDDDHLGVDARTVVDGLGDWKAAVKGGTRITISSYACSSADVFCPHLVETLSSDPHLSDLQGPGVTGALFLKCRTSSVSSRVGHEVVEPAREFRLIEHSYHRQVLHSIRTRGHKAHYVKERNHEGVLKEFAVRSFAGPGQMYDDFTVCWNLLKSGPNKVVSCNEVEPTRKIRKFQGISIEVTRHVLRACWESVLLSDSEKLREPFVELPFNVDVNLPDVDLPVRTDSWEHDPWRAEYINPSWNGGPFQYAGTLPSFSEQNHSHYKALVVANAFYVVRNEAAWTGDARSVFLQNCDTGFDTVDQGFHTGSSIRDAVIKDAASHNEGMMSSTDIMQLMKKLSYAKKEELNNEVYKEFALLYR